MTSARPSLSDPSPKRLHRHLDRQVDVVRRDDRVRTLSLRDQSTDLRLDGHEMPIGEQSEQVGCVRLEPGPDGRPGRLNAAEHPRQEESMQEGRTFGEQVKAHAPDRSVRKDDQWGVAARDRVQLGE